MKKKLIVSLGAGVLLSAFALYLAFRNVPFSDLLSYIGAIRFVWMLPTVLIIAAGFFLRALRWQMILGTTASVEFRMAYHPLVIGFMLNNILPGRIGEVARPLILNRKTGVSFTSGFATVAAERIFDTAFLVLFLALALTAVPMETSFHVSYGQYHLNRETLEMLGINLMKLCILCLAGAGLVAFDRTRAVINRIIDRFPDMMLLFVSPAIRERIRRSFSEPAIRLLNHAAEGLMLFKHPWKMLACAGVTLIIWFLTALSYYVMAIGCPQVHLSLYELSIMMVIICFFIALPSVPGYWGLWEAGGVFALSLFGVPQQTAAGFTLVNHVVQLFPVIFMGFFSAFALSVNIHQISRGLRSG